MTGYLSFFGGWPLSPWGMQLAFVSSSWAVLFCVCRPAAGGMDPGVTVCSTVAVQQQDCFKIKLRATSLVEYVSCQAGPSGLGRALSPSQALTSKVYRAERICLGGKSQHFLLIIWILLASQSSDS